MRRAVNSSPKADGDYARKSTYARVHYRAMLENGEVLADSRSDGGEPLELRVGAEPSECVPGWDMALPKMRAGERVVLVCEPRYAFGEAGVAPHIPPMATVRFDIELLSVRDLLSSNNTETVDFLEKYAHVMAQNEIGKITAEAEADAKADEEARAKAEAAAAAKAEAAAAAKAEAFFAAEARAVGENGVIDIASSTEELTPETAAAAAAAAQAQVDAKRRAQQGAAEGGNGTSPAAGTPSSTGQGRGWVPSATRVRRATRMGIVGERRTPRSNFAFRCLPKLLAPSRSRSRLARAHSACRFWASSSPPSPAVSSAVSTSRSRHGATSPLTRRTERRRFSSSI